MSLPADGVAASRAVLAHLAEHDFPSRSPLYAAIARGMLGDDEVLGLCEGVAWNELPPLRLLAAVRHLLIGDPTEPLAAFHADLTGEPRPPDEAYPLFRDFVLRNRDSVTELVRTRAIQTNDVLRCACYMPAVALAAGVLGTAEIGLVDVGSSAGLGMLLDRYAYDYGPAGTVGPAGAPVRLRCEVRGDRPPPLDAAPPRIAHRVGLDRAPVDILDPDATRWLRASTWPGQAGRVDLLLGAVEAARADPPHVVQGDAVRDLPALLAAVPPGLGVCVTTSVLLTYLGGARDAFTAALEEAGRSRPIAWVCYDNFLGIDRIAEAPPWVDALREMGNVDCALVRLSLLTAAGREDRWLARSGYHGEWIEWMDAPG